MEYENQNSPVILLFEPDPAMHEFLSDVLAFFRYRPEPMPNEDRIRARLAEIPTPDLLIVGGRPRNPEIPKLVRFIRESGYRIPIILIGGGENRIFHPEAWRNGAILVQLTAPISIDDLTWVIERALENRR